MTVSVTASYSSHSRQLRESAPEPENGCGMRYGSRGVTKVPRPGVAASGAPRWMVKVSSIVHSRLPKKTSMDRLIAVPAPLP